jgi:hypothetical protein
MKVERMKKERMKEERMKEEGKPELQMPRRRRPAGRRRQVDQLRKSGMSGYPLGGCPPGPPAAGSGEENPLR